ncbi:MAG: hypothetical protein Q9225_006449 [Loekoesia sp. 1 TL-2023]
MADPQAVPTSAHNENLGVALESQKGDGDSTRSALNTIEWELQETNTDELKAVAQATTTSCGEHVKIARSEKPFPFMKLPPELRLMVFKEVLIEPSDIGFHYDQWAKLLIATIDDEHDDGGVYYHPAATCSLFGVSKDFYKEAMPVYFGCNTFFFSSLDALMVLSNLKVEYRRSIKSLRVCFWGLSPAKSARLLRGCTGLRQLSLRMGNRRVRYSGMPFLPRLNWDGVNDLLKVRGITDLKVTPFDYKCKGQFPDQFVKGWEPFVERLQILKQPYSAAELRRQDMKDYPPKRAKRTVFGKTNVMTRSERKLVETATKGQQRIDEQQGPVAGEERSCD